MLEYTIYIIAVFIVAWLVYRVIRFQMRKRLYQSTFSSIFSNQGFPTPTLKNSSLYGYPTFEITFASQNDFNIAVTKGLTEEFKHEIQKVHSNIKDFEADQAVNFTWEGNTQVY